MLELVCINAYHSSMSKHSKKLDLNQLAKRIVDEAAGEIAPEEEIDEKKKAAIESGRLGGLKGGKARADKLTPEERSEIARNSANSRWKKIHQN